MATEDREFTPPEHSKVVGGSSAALIIACPGSYQEQQGYPEQQSNDSADEGTALHEAAAWILANDEEPESCVNRKFYGITITEELYLEKLLPAIDLFDDLAAYYEDTDGGFTFLIEQRCEMPGIPEAFGTSDIVFKTPKRGGIIDWKFGYRLVKAIENAQTRYYARSALFSLKKSFFTYSDHINYQDPDTPFDLIIIQPMVDYGFDEVVHRDKDIHTLLTDVGALWTTDVKGLEEFRMLLVSKVAEATGPNPRLCRGDHCKDKYCRAITGCPEWTGVIEKLKEARERNDIVVKKGAVPSHKVPTPEELAAILDLEPDYKAFFAAANGLAFDYAMGGTRIPDRKLVAKQGNRTWVEEDQTKVLSQLKRMGLNQNDCVTAPKLKGPKPIEDLLKTKGKELPADMVYRPDNGRQLVPLSSKAPEVSSTSTALLELAAKLEGTKK